MAMAGVILILALYATTIILAIFGNEKTTDLLKLSIYATVVVPVLIWAYTFIYRLLGKYYSQDPGTDPGSRSSNAAHNSRGTDAGSESTDTAANPDDAADSTPEADAADTNSRT